MDNRNVVSIEDRIPKLKQARKKKANRRLIFYLSIFFLLLSIVVYLQSPLSHVKTIDIKGNSMISDDELLALSELTNDTNIWTIKKEKVSEKIQKNPLVDSVKIKRDLPRTVEISIKEYNVVGFFKEKNGFSQIIEDGTILKDKTQSTIHGKAPLLVDFSENNYLKKMAKELHALPQSILSMISEVHWKPTKENKNKVLLYMNDGYVVSSTIRDFADKMAVYPSIVSQLEPEKEGIIHIGGGAYFEAFDNE